MIKGQTVMLKDHVKIMGVIMDSRLKYKQYIAHEETVSRVPITRVSGNTSSARCTGGGVGVHRTVFSTIEPWREMI